MEDKEKGIIKNKDDLFKFLFAVFILALIGYVGIRIINFILNAIKTVIIDYPTISVALITGLLAFISLVVGKFLENRYTIKNKIREERQKVYTDFLDWLIDNILLAKINGNDNIVEEIKEQQELITIYASDKVLKAWAKFKDISMHTVMNNTELSKEEKTKIFINEEAPYIEKLILAIREELGYKNKDIKTYDILRLYVNDIDKYL